jgi:large subunit ribosomal protein L18
MSIPNRRRREGKTNYKKRLKVLRGARPRIVVRKTNRYVFAQYVLSSEAQDQVIFSMSSKDLLEYGWPKTAEGSLKSLPAASLTGYLMGKLLKEKKIKEEPILDKGLARHIYKSRIFAFMKGLQEAGIGVSSKKEEVFPEKERLEGKHLGNKDVAKIIQKVKEAIDKKHAA